MRSVFLAMVSSLGLLLGACGGPVLHLPAGGCTLDTQCKGERVCFEARCVFPGQIGRDAGVLDAGPDAGRPDAGPVDAGLDAGPDAGPPGDGIIGDACTRSSDCTEGGPPICYSEADSFGTFVGGYCSAECSPDTLCPGDTVCAIIFSNSGVCLKACQGADVCRAEYRCSDLFGSPACVPVAIVP